MAFLEPDRGVLAEPLLAQSVGLQAVHARGLALAAFHDATITRRDGGASLIARLRRNVHVLREAAAVLEHDIEPGVYASPAAQWLSDNLALIDEQLEDVTESLPAGWFRDLPLLGKGDSAGTPRVLDTAWVWLSTTGQRFDPVLLDAFFDGYQAQREPNWGEWWALQQVLRLVLVEQLRRLGERVAVDKAARTLAHAIAAGPVPRPEVLAGVIQAVQARGAGPAFLLQLHASRRETENPVVPPGGWAAHVPQPAAAQQLQQAADAGYDADVAEAVRSVRAVGRFRWREWIERRSLLAAALRQLPVFEGEDDGTQNRTVHALERWSRRTGIDELTMARALVACVRTAGAGPALHATPGYWLTGGGRQALAASLQVSAPPPPPGPQRWPRVRLPLYLGLMAATTALGVAMAWPAGTQWPASYGVGGVLGALAVLLLVLLPASEMAVAAWNRLLSEWLAPRRLPRMAFDDGIPAPHRVLVVVPCLLSKDADIDALGAQIERHHLASNEAWAQYALLSDLVDAARQHLDSDAARTARAVAVVRALNSEYAPLPDGAPRFLLLHRLRTWSAEEARWMGWERKRGKLEQLVALLAAPGLQPATSNDLPALQPASSAAMPAPPSAAFVDIAGLSAPAPATPYIVVLDSDTLLPPGSLRALVSVAAHPANAPRLDAAGTRVIAGHGVLQPRVALPLPLPGSSTLFHALTAGFSGLDPYGSAASEVYEDLFDEGSFSGKGLLHVATAHAVLGGRLPQGQVLSHDLLEGALLRCAALGDVALLEGAPVHPDVADSRMHRWTRGDWQLLPFIAHPRFWRVTPLNVWKMVDNLRRSLVAPACVALLLAAFATGWPAPQVALFLVLGAFGAGPLVGAVAAFAPSDDRLALRPLARNALKVLLRAVGSVVWHFAQLLQQAVLRLDAIARALFRHFISRRHMLAWTTAAAAEAAAVRDLATLWRRHRRISACAALLAAGLVLLPGPASGGGLMLCLVWGLAPLWTWAAAQPLGAAAPKTLPAEALADLHDIAAETWRFFDRQVGPQTHHLPPDNHQRLPHAQTASATSPTNIGMYLLALMCAWRFGFLGQRDTLARVAATLATLEQLPRHHGHFFNWIDTRSLAVLPPAYVSTVDSGNLCAALIALAQGLRERAPTAGAARGAPTAGAVNAAPGDSALARNAQLLAGAAERGLLAGLDASTTRLAVLAAVPQGRAGADELVQASATALLELNQRLHAFDEETAFDGTPPQEQERVWWRLADQLAMLHSLALDAATPASGFGHEVSAQAEFALASTLAARAEALAWAPQFGWLYDRERALLHIGAQISLEDSSERLDHSHYDLLASEARLASLLAIAKGDLPMKHWARLERATFANGDGVGLQSWSGSMFEYLMPMLLVDEPEGSLLHGAAIVAVREQRQLGQLWHLPWGVSESAHAERDASLAYQYGPQGAPRLALRRTPPGERVIAPYATLLAAQVAPLPAWRNLVRLERRGGRDRYGYIEALDFTPARQHAGSELRRVVTFMAHHQGMALVSLANVLLDGAARRWFMSHPRVRAVSPLLHEPVPAAVRALRGLPLLPAGSARGGEDGNGNGKGNHSGPLGPFGDGGPALPARELLPGSHALEPVSLLGNGRYSVLLHPDGSGASRWQGQAVTRWRDDALRRQHGTFFYLRVADAAVADESRSATLPGPWCSLTHHPAPAADVEYRCEWQAHAASFTAQAQRWTALTRVWVAPEDDIELREITLHAKSDRGGDAALAIELASYFEVALLPQAADESHPAFANLFVAARWDPQTRALWLQRRGRLDGDPTLHAVHFVAQVERDDGAGNGPEDGVRDDDTGLSFNAVTDRAHALGRGRSVAAPARQMQADAADTNLDPVASIGVRGALPTGGRLTICFATAVAGDEASLQRIVDRYTQRSVVARAWRMCATLAAISLRESGLGAAAWHAWQALSTPLAVQLARPSPAAVALQVLQTAAALPGFAAAAALATPALAPSTDPDAIAAIDRRALWRVGLSGERPLFLLRVPGVDGLPLAEWLARVTPLWARYGLAVDVVFLNTEAASYHQAVQQGLARLVEMHTPAAARPAASACKLLLLRAEDLSALELATLRRLARVDVRADGRPLRTVLRELRAWHAADLERRQALLVTTVPWLAAPPDAASARPQPVVWDHNNGGCSFRVGPAQRPLRPWTQVLANAAFGTQVTEAGGGHSWAHNSRQLQITPWSNDPLCDPAGEWLLLQDLDSGRVWNAFPAPWGAADVPYRVEHGPGWTRVTHQVDGLAVELEVVVDDVLALKQTHITLRKLGAAAATTAARRVRVVATAQWQLGARWADRASICSHQQWVPAGLVPTLRLEEAEQRALVLHATQTDAGVGYGLATAFLALRPASPQPQWAFDWTADRRELFDARGHAVLPEELNGRESRDGLGLDPCAALSLTLTLRAGQSESLTVLLGHADSPRAARQLASLAVHGDPAALSKLARDAWQQRQGTLQVQSPDPQFDMLVNHWLRYQSLACRLWARAGFYQAGGAFGFRDQLQDAMALTDVDGGLLQAQIMLAASRQFSAGDVQHWWHPAHIATATATAGAGAGAGAGTAADPAAHTGAGVRTRFSDDLLWLVAALLRHLDTGGSAALLDRRVPFLEGRAVADDAEDVYETARVADEVASIWEHAARALDHSLRLGAHGLPLMGSGDWNDGMNRVGIHGRGESVWLAWFVLTLLEPMAQWAEQRQEPARAQRWRGHAVLLRQALDSAGWDGAWYRRAYFDDGSPLGSASNSECQIDLIAQAWSVFASGLPAEADVAPAAKERPAQAMAAAAARLFDGGGGGGAGMPILRLLHPPLQHQQPSAGYIQAYPKGVRENGGQYSHAATWAAMAFAQLGDAEKAWRAWCSVSPAHRHQHDVQQPPMPDLNGPAAARRVPYGLEPYAVAGDVYAEAPWAGRGGWSWYTGAAGWLYRAAVESLLGLQRQGSNVRFSPVLPPHWPSVCVSLRWAGCEHRFHLGPAAAAAAATAAATSAASAAATEGPAGVLQAGDWLDLQTLNGDSRWVLAARSQRPPLPERAAEMGTH